MTRTILATLVFLALIVLSGCVSPDAIMKSFVGQHSSELVARWGPPQQRMPDGQGGEIWTYLQQRQWTTPGYANTNAYATQNTYGNIYGANYTGNTYAYGGATTTYTPPQTQGYTATRSFFIDKQGIIYRYAWKGR